MAIKELFTKYKLYTILSIITLVLIISGVVLGVSLSKETNQSAGAAVGDTFTVGDLNYEITVEGTNGEGEVEVTGPTSTSITSATIPSSVSYGGVNYNVTSIGNNAFYRCNSLISATIGNDVKSIGNSAFDSCSFLETVTIGNRVASIGQTAFYWCTGLIAIYFYNEITSEASMIGTFAFLNYNSDVTYYFKDQTSLNNARNVHGTKFSSTNFQLMTFVNITVNSNNENYGTVSDSTGNYAVGTSIVISATPNENCGFLGWSLDGGNSIIEGTENQTSYVVNITNDATYTAVFDMITYNITVNSNNGVYGSASGGGQLPQGANTLTATADPNYQLVGWSLDGGQTLLGDSIGMTNYTITVTQDATYTAVFEPIVTITSLNSGAEFTIIRESVDNVVHSYVIQMNSGYYINGIYAANTATQPTTNDFTKIKSIDGYLQNDYSTVIHYITNTTGTQLILEIYNIGEPFTIYLDFVTTVQNFKAGGSIEGIALSVKYQGSEIDLVVAGSAKILGYTTINGLETVNVVAQAYTDYTFLGWQIDGEYITYQDETSGETITLQGYDYISASIPLSVIDGKQVIAVFTSTAELNANDQTNSVNSGVM